MTPFFHVEFHHRHPPQTKKEKMKGRMCTYLDENMYYHSHVDLSFQKLS